MRSTEKQRSEFHRAVAPHVAALVPRLRLRAATQLPQSSTELRMQLQCRRRHCRHLSAAVIQRHWPSCNLERLFWTSGLVAGSMFCCLRDGLAQQEKRSVWI